VCTGEKTRPTSRAFAVWIIARERRRPHSRMIVTKRTAPEKAEMSPIGMGADDERPPHRCGVCNALATKVLYRDGKVTYYCDDHVPP
jgi:hypothetical protein